MKKWYIAIIITFFVPVVSIGLISLFDTDETIAYDENRTLEKMPVFSFDTWFDESFALDFEKYYNDHFPFRETFINSNQALNRFYIFNIQSEDTAVIISQDDAQMLTGGDVFINEEDYYNVDDEVLNTPSPSETTESSTPENTETIEEVTEPDYPAEEDAKYAGNSVILVGDAAMEITSINEYSIDKYALIINEVARRCGEDVRFFNLLIPTGGQFYSPESYHTGEYDQELMIDRCYEQLVNISGVDAYSSLEEHTDEYIYYRTDHHWTARGAYYGYEAFCESAGFEPVLLEEFETGQYDKFIGSLYGYVKDMPQSTKLKENPDTVEYFLPIYDTDARYYDNYYMKGGIEIDVVNTTISENFGNKYLCFTAGDCPLLRIDTGNKNGKSVLLVKESYGNAFTPFLTSHYETVYTLDPRKFNTDEYPNKFYLADFVKAHEIDDVIVLNNTFMINSRGFGRLIAATIN